MPNSENPYKEIEEEKIRVPKRPERINDTGNDRLFLLIFCLVMAVFLVVVVKELHIVYIEKG